jgi:hypothetical protein
MRGNKYFEWLGQMDCLQGVSLSQRANRLSWSRASREAYARGHMRESDRPAAEQFHRMLRKQNERAH